MGQAGQSLPEREVDGSRHRRGYHILIEHIDFKVRHTCCGAGPKLLNLGPCLVFLLFIFGKKILEKSAVLRRTSDLNRFKLEAGVSKNAKKVEMVENLMIFIFQNNTKHLLSGDFIPV